MAARLDLRRNGGGYEATFTSRWGVSSSLIVTETDGTLTLAGDASVPWPTGSAAFPRAGFAGLLAPPMTGRVQLRYRALARPEGANALFLYGDVLTLELARGGLVLDTGVKPVDVKFLALAPPIDGMSHATEWTTLDVPAPAGSGFVGVALSVGRPTLLGGGCGGPPPPRVDVELLVERIASL